MAASYSGDDDFEMYTAEELTAWLRAAGFTRIRTYGDMKLRRPADGAQRIYFVCERNQN